MSLHNAAKYLQSKGRGNDKMLVHMTPREVQGLQKLALASGGSLSINPHTGLIEAGWLESLLPTVAGAALMATGVGAPMAAALVGGGTTLMTGNLQKGLMAGLGAYGGAGLGEAFGAAGAAESGMAEGAKALGTTKEAIATPQGFEKALSSPSTYEGADIMTSHVTDPSKVQTFADAYQQGAVTPDTFMGRVGQMGEGAKSVFGNTDSALEFGKQNLGKIGAAAAPMMADMGAPIPGGPKYEATNPFVRKRIGAGFKGSFQEPNMYRGAFAAGGLADITMAEGGQFDDSPGADAMASGGITRYAGTEGSIVSSLPKMRMGEGVFRDTDEDTVSRPADQAAQIKLKKIAKAANMPKGFGLADTKVAQLGTIHAASGGSLGSYSDGGRMLKGPGDGMSDSIPASIGGKQPARLADGEFVVPADVVSHLGNGSTDAGAKKLYSMMNKIRKARTGRKQQAPAVKSDKYLPV